MRFLRFSTRTRADSGVFVGALHVAHDLKEENRLLPTEIAWVEEALAWFRENLPVPSRFAMKPHGVAVAVCWFKDTAREHIRHARGLAALLEEHGVRVDRLESRRPGYVVYEDPFQVAAIPFGRTLRREATR
jgi:hypothetical protein